MNDTVPASAKGENVNMAPENPAVTPSGKPASFWIIAVLALALGLAGRFALTQAAPMHAYLWDHLDNIDMGLTASHYGLTGVYSVSEWVNNPIVFGRHYTPDGNFTIEPRKAPRVANYPPLGVTVFWLNSKLLGLPHDSTKAESFCPRCQARQTETLNLTAPPEVCTKCKGAYLQYRVDDSITVNTFASRLIMSIPSLLADILLAAGLFLLGRLMGGAKAGLIAAAVCWLLPPLAMDTSYWGQTDSWMLACTVWFIYLMLRGKWIGAGVLAAITALLKPQGMLLGPIALFGAFTLASPAGRLLRDGAVRLGKMAAAGILTLVLLTLPWTISSGMDWFEASYVSNFKTYGQTTLAAFNFWYVDALQIDSAQQRAVQAARPTQRDLEALYTSPGLKSDAEMLGTAKDDWGKLLTIAALIFLAVMSWLKHRDKPELALVLFGGLWLWSTFMWPTRVHERYIVYGIPLVVLAATVRPRLWPAVIALAAVGAAEMCHNNWISLQPGRVGQIFASQAAQMIQANRSAPVQALQDAMGEIAKPLLAMRSKSQMWELLATTLSLMGFGWAIFAAFWRRPSEQPELPTEMLAPVSHRRKKKR